MVLMIVMILLMVIVDGDYDIVVDDDDRDGTISITYLYTQCCTCDERKERYLSHTSTAMNMLHDGLEGGRSII